MHRWIRKKQRKQWSGKQEASWKGENDKGHDKMDKL